MCFDNWLQILFRCLFVFKASSTFYISPIISLLQKLTIYACFETVTPCLLQVFITTSSHKLSSGNRVNVSSVRELADIVLGQHTLPSWYPSSVDAVLEHGEVSLHPHNRWQTQMAFFKTVYSFQVKEDTLPG